MNIQFPCLLFFLFFFLLWLLKWILNDLLPSVLLAVTFSAAGSCVVFVFWKIHHRNYFQHHLIFTHLLQTPCQQTRTKLDFKKTSGLQLLEKHLGQEHYVIQSALWALLLTWFLVKHSVCVCVCVCACKRKRVEEEGKRGESDTPAHVEDYQRWWALSEADVCEE